MPLKKGDVVQGKGEKRGVVESVAADGKVTVSWDEAIWQGGGTETFTAARAATELRVVELASKEDVDKLVAALLANGVPIDDETRAGFEIMSPDEIAEDLNSVLAAAAQTASENGPEGDAATVAATTPIPGEEPLPPPLAEDAEIPDIPFDRDEVIKRIIERTTDDFGPEYSVGMLLPKSPAELRRLLKSLPDPAATLVTERADRLSQSLAQARDYLEKRQEDKDDPIDKDEWGLVNATLNETGVGQELAAFTENISEIRAFVDALLEEAREEISLRPDTKNYLLEAAINRHFLDAYDDFVSDLLPVVKGDVPSTDEELVAYRDLYNYMKLQQTESDLWNEYLDTVDRLDQSVKDGTSVREFQLHPGQVNEVVLTPEFALQFFRGKLVRGTLIRDAFQNMEGLGEPGVFPGIDSLERALLEVIIPRQRSAKRSTAARERLNKEFTKITTDWQFQSDDPENELDRRRIFADLISAIDESIVEEALEEYANLALGEGGAPYAFDYAATVLGELTVLSLTRSLGAEAVEVIVPGDFKKTMENLNVFVTPEEHVAAAEAEAKTIVERQAENAGAAFESFIGGFIGRLPPDRQMVVENAHPELKQRFIEENELAVAAGQTPPSPEAFLASALEETGLFAQAEIEDIRKAKEASAVVNFDDAVAELQLRLPPHRAEALGRDAPALKATYLEQQKRIPKAREGVDYALGPRGVPTGPPDALTFLRENTDFVAEAERIEESKTAATQAAEAFLTTPLGGLREPDDVSQPYSVAGALDLDTDAEERLRELLSATDEFGNPKPVTLVEMRDAITGPISVPGAEALSGAEIGHLSGFQGSVTQFFEGMSRGQGVPEGKAISATEEITDPAILQQIVTGLASSFQDVKEADILQRQEQVQPTYQPPFQPPPKLPTPRIIRR